MPVWTHYFAHFVVAVIATISFGITFQMPRRHYLACGLTGAVGWMVYIFGVELFALSPAIATLVATLPLTGCARFFSIRHKAPVTIFLLPGIFPLVPGAGIYYTAYYFLQGEEVLFASKGAETFKVALALACPCREATNPKSSPIPRSAKDGVLFCVKILFFAGQTSII